MSEQRKHSEKKSWNDEISLIDLLAVLLRRRRLILVCTLIALIMGTAAVLILPERKYQKSIENRTYEAIINCRPSSGVLNLYEQEELDQLILLVLTNPVNILEALKKAQIERIADIKINGIDDSELIYAIDQRLVRNLDKEGNEISPIYTSYKVRGSYKVSLKLKEDDKAKQFLINMVDMANDHLTRIILPEAEAEMRTFENISSIEYPRQVIEENLQSAYERYTSAVRFFSGEEEALIPIQGPFVLIPEIELEDIREGILTKTIIAVVGVFFVSVLLAFFIHWVENVRKDPESMAKIHEALGKEKQ